MLGRSRHLLRHSSHWRVVPPRFLVVCAALGQAHTHPIRGPSADENGGQFFRPETGEGSLVTCKAAKRASPMIHKNSDNGFVSSSDERQRFNGKRVNPRADGGRDGLCPVLF